MAITLNVFIVNLTKLKKDFPEIVRILLEEKSKDFIKANTDNWNKGLMPSGEKLTNQFTNSTNYSLSWAAARKEKGLPYDHYRLKFTGELEHSLNFDIKVKKGNITGNITIPPTELYAKGNDLYKMFGDFVGVPNEYLSIFVNWFQKELLKEIKFILFKS